MSEPQTKVSVYRGGELVHEQVVAPGDYTIAEDGAVRACAPGETPVGPTLRIVGDEWRVEDQGTLDGTVLDGEEVTVPTIIMPGQNLRHRGLDITLASAGPADLGPEDSIPDVAVRQPSIADIRSPDRYSMRRRVGRGGMGIVMSARDLILQREVAMKLMFDRAKPSSVARFYQEAQITAQLEHPNIVPVHELNLNDGDKPFYTMKLVRGTSLKKVLERLGNEDPAYREQWPLSALLTVFQKVCDAIAFAHARGVIHRDLKPDNIMLGGYGEVQVMDWGLAKILGQESPSGIHSPVAVSDPMSTSSGEKSTVDVTMSGTIIGTPQYMSPEQASGDIALMDACTDIYSLGVILYHILALRVPFEGRTTEEVLRNVRAGRALPLAEAGTRKKLVHIPGGRVPESLVAVVAQAMALEKGDRYGEVTSLQADIKAYQDGFATSAEHAGMWKLAGLFIRRNRAVSAAVLALMVAGVVFAFNLKRERDRATEASQQAQVARGIADEQRNAAEDHLYLSEMLQAGRHLADGRPESARELLARHQVEPSGRNLREWEWYYLLGEANQDRLHVQAHAHGVFSLAASADGSRLATGGGDGEVAIWQARGLVPEFRLPAVAGRVWSVAWHQGGKLLAAGYEHGLVRVWNLETRQSVAEFRGSTDAAIRSVQWRPDSADQPTLVIGSSEKEILLWRPLAPGQEGTPQVFASTAGKVVSLHWSADGARLAAAEMDAGKPIEVFAFDSRNKILSATVAAGNDALAIAMNPSGKYVAAGSKHLLVLVYDLETKAPVFSEALHRGFVSGLAWSPDGRMLATASHDGTIRVSDPVQGKLPVRILSGHRDAVNALIWTTLPALPGAGTKPTALFSGGADGTLRAWSVQQGVEFEVKDRNWIAATYWNPEGSRVAVASFRDQIYLCDPATGQSVPIPAIRGNFFDVAWSPSGDRLATTSRDNGLVETFEAASGRPLGTYGLPRAYRVAWSASGKYLAACGPEGARVWNTKTGALVASIPLHSGSLLWHPDERQIILGGENGAIEIWDALEGTLVATWRQPPATPDSIVVSPTEPPHRVFDLRWSPDHRSVAFATQDSMVGILDASNGRLLRTFPGHTSGVWRVAWNADGRRLATVGQDGMLRIFDTIVGGQVAHINHGLGKSELHALDWSPGGRRVVSGGFDRTVRMWDARRGEQIDAVESLARQADVHSNSESLRKLFQLYVRLGWVDAAREIARTALTAAPDDMMWKEESLQAEAAFAGALEPEPTDDSSVFIALLNKIRDGWNAGNAQVTVKAWRELAGKSGAEAPLEFARNYLSRAAWTVKWFPSSVDPMAEPVLWRGQAFAARALKAGVHTLSFPYHYRGPKDLLLDASPAGQGPGAKDFGMIANAEINLAAGKWRLRTIGDGGVRVLVNEQPVIESWTAGGPLERVGDYEQATTGMAQITVENLVREGTEGFQFFIEPVVE